MKILIVGGGGREHALAWAAARHGHEVIAAPGNPGMAKLAKCADVGSGDVGLLVALAAGRGVELVVVGPEVPLVAGLGDALREAGVPCFGPSADGAQLEGSKLFTKEILEQAKVPTAAHRAATNMAQVDLALEELGGDVVVKADGLAAGKGVFVAGSAGEARAAAEAMLDGRFGEAGKTLVIERKLRGREVSVLALTDGKRLVVLPPAEDHKALHDGDLGPNTGGMGVVSPADVLSPELLVRVEREVLAPTLGALASRGIDYRGVLYAGLMVQGNDLNVLEYNCRFGDPETQPLMMRWQDDPVRWLHGAATGRLPEGKPEFAANAAVAVVMAAQGYPEAPTKGDPIEGIAAAEEQDGVTVFHAGTRAEGAGVVTAGGRVLTVTAVDSDVERARDKAYEAVRRISFRGAHYRQDIGARGRAC